MRYSLGLFGFLLLALACVGGCSSSSGTEAGDLSACQPLAPVTSPVTLTEAEIVGAGKAADGTLYVVTKGELGPRLFVSTGGGLLIEQYVNGSGGYTLVMYQDAQGVQYVIEIDGEGADMRMGIVMGPQPNKTFEIGSVGEELTVLDASVVAAMSAQTTRTFHVDYAGEASDGTYIVVSAPDHASSYDDFRLFLGQIDALKEQVITEFDASVSNDKLVKFTFNGASVELDYRSDVAAASLTSGSMVESFSGSADSPLVAPSGAVFRCR